MTVEVMLLVYCTGAAVLALWLDQRFRGLVPGDLRGALVRLVVVLALGWLAIPGIGAAIDAGVSPVGAMLAVVLPVLTSFFLAAIWLMRTVQAMLPGLRR